ncbi:hypothetical protein [Actinophytocola sp.]|uniref:hypothetical protein n=1 Tax=Actinophytocola sp. TaxID=1872138 RepID=UPI002ED1211B
MGLRRGLSVVLGILLGIAFLSSPAVAAPPAPSAISVSSTQLAPGQEFTVSFELFNADTSTITSVNAQLGTVGTNIVDLLDLVSCTGSVSVCHPTLHTFRGPVGDLVPGATRTVVFTFRVKETAAAGGYTLEHQFIGGNFAFAPGTGPVLTITPQAADLAVSLDASPKGILTSKVTYTVKVKNNGPGNASSARISGHYAAGFSWNSGNGCVRTTGQSVRCDFSAIPVGGSATASFSVNAGLLAIGSFTTSVSRTSSSPADPVSGNDNASRSCSAITGLLVLC